MNREEPQFYDIYAQPWRQAHGQHEVVNGLETRLVSHDNRTGAATYMAELPAGFRRTLKADEAAVEAFVMRGDLSVNGESVGCSGFLGIPQYCGPAKLASRGGATVYFFINPNLPLPAYTSGIHVSRVWRQQWIHAEMTNLRHGLMFKSLRVPDPASGALHGGPGGFLRMTLMTPGFMEPRHEVHHSCWEEIIILKGDLMMKDRGLHAGGTYLGNPTNMWHYPAATLAGCLLLIQTDAAQDVEFRNYDGGYPFLADYLDTASWLDEPKHSCWAHPVETEYWTGETAAGVAGLAKTEATGAAGAAAAAAAATTPTRPGKG